MDVKEIKRYNADWIKKTQNGNLEGPSESGKKISVSLKCGEFVDYLRNLWHL